MIYYVECPWCVYCCVFSHLTEVLCFKGTFILFNTSIISASYTAEQQPTCWFWKRHWWARTFNTPIWSDRAIFFYISSVCAERETCFGVKRKLRNNCCIYWSNFWRNKSWKQEMDICTFCFGKGVKLQLTQFWTLFK